jgi:hypothetical protein
MRVHVFGCPYHENENGYALNLRHITNQLDSQSWATTKAITPLSTALGIPGLYHTWQL